MEKSNKRFMPTRTVKIDEDERESLRRLAESSTTTTRKHKVKPVTNTKNNCSHVRSRLSSSTNKVQDIHVIADHGHQYYDILEEKRVVTQKPSKKLESKQSEDINESAEKFIQQFRQQLILQRLESIENVEKMLERGL